MLIGVVMVVLLLAGFGKASDVAGFANELGQWSLIPPRFVPMIAVVVPTLETGLAAAWLLGQCRTAMAIAAIGLIAGLTTMYCVEWALASAPRCQCFGVLARFRAWEAHAQWVIVRNALLLSVAVFGLWLGMRSTDARSV